jgi:flagellin-specific chaperone FliS
MKVKHNKKRNTAFLFEALVRELTKSVIEKDKDRTAKVKNILKEHFQSSSILGKELDCYQALSEESGLDQYTAEKLVFRAKKAYDDLDQKKVFEAQSSVISKINKLLGKEVYNTFIPNYQSLASITQIFNEKIPVKTRVLMEQKVIEKLTDSERTTEDVKPIDSLVVKSFTDTFNNTYSDLLEEQKELLTKYITSFDNNGVEFRLFAGRELQRLYGCIEESLTLKEVSEDPEMIENTKRVLDKINELNVSKLSEKDILKVLKLQNLVSEYTKNANQD